MTRTKTIDQHYNPFLTFVAKHLLLIEFCCYVATRLCYTIVDEANQQLTCEHDFKKLKTIREDNLFYESAESVSDKISSSNGNEENIDE